MHMKASLTRTLQGPCCDYLHSQQGLKLNFTQPSFVSAEKPHGGPNDLFSTSENNNAKKHLFICTRFEDVLKADFWSGLVWCGHPLVLFMPLHSA